MLVLAVLFTPRGVLGVFENIGKYFSERKKSRALRCRSRDWNRAFGALPVTRDVNLTLERGRAPRAHRAQRRRQDDAW